MSTEHQEGGQGHREVTIIYNGVEKRFAYDADEKVRALLDKAIREFRITQNPHLLGLFNTEGRELPDNDTLKAAGVEPGATLLLRPSSVRGGERC
jgi:hypothetical protein